METWVGWKAGPEQYPPTRLNLAPGLPACPILRYHPSVIAHEAATLGVMAPGR